MASWLVRSSPDRGDPVSSPGACFSKVRDEKFSHSESRGIISNLFMITELFPSYKIFQEYTPLCF